MRNKPNTDTDGLSFNHADLMIGGRKSAGKKNMIVYFRSSYETS